MTHIYLHAQCNNNMNNKMPTHIQNQISVLYYYYMHVYAGLIYAVNLFFYLGQKQAA